MNSIARERSSAARRRAPVLAKDQSADEIQRTRDWFREARACITEAQKEVDKALKTALPGSEDELTLLELSGTLRDRFASLNQAEESFLAESSELALSPPSQSDIDKTKQLATDLGDRIAAERTAQAVVALLDDLAGLATKLTTPRP